MQGRFHQIYFAIGKEATVIALYVISDLHLSTLDSTNKSMEVFGRRWQDYIQRIEQNWKRLILPEDTVIIPGDISWALSLEESLSDMKFLDSLPGKKILGKGNHDFWWSTMKKHEEFFKKNGIKTISFLYNNAYESDSVIIAGTRGWYNDADATGAPDNADFQKLINRESLRLKASLASAEELKKHSPDKEIVAFLHFPPFWNNKESGNLCDILLEHGVRRVYFGHIHGNYTVPSQYEYKGIVMTIVSADYLEFVPKIVK